MKREVNVDSILDSWFTEGPTNLPDRTVAAIVDGLEDVHQRGSVALPWRLSMPRVASALASAAIVLLAGVVALGLYFNQPNVGVNPSSTPSASPTATAGSPEVFTEIAPGEMVEMPDWPLTARTTPPMVWSGTELIVWGDGIYGLAGDGAAFDLANGTWRVIAEAPLSPRCCHAAAWTGTEMIVWGGRVENSFYYDGAAYNPVTDTWRLLAPASAFSGKDPSMIWIGDEAVVFGVAGNSDTTGEHIAGAAYDPVTDSWRALADSPTGVRADDGKVWWTGESIITANVGYGPENDRIAHYDLAADRWTMVEIGSSAAVVGVPGLDGRVSTFVSLPYEAGAPVQLIDGTGDLIAELPAFPGDSVGDQVWAYGVWVGGEAVFEIWNSGPDYQPEQIWALNPSTGTWRRLDTGTPFPRIDSSVRVAGDLLLMWNSPNDVYRGPPRACCVAPPSKGGSIYRVGIPSPSQVP